MEKRGIRSGLLPILLTITACRPATTPPPAPGEATDPPPTQSSADTREAWDLITLSGQSVGYQVTQMRQISQGKRLLRETTAKSELTVQRFGQSTNQRMELVSRETTDGQLQDFSCTISSGQQPVRTIGIRREGLLKMTTVTEGSEQSWTLSVPNPCGGLFAVEHSLLNQPLQPGATRSIQAIVPVLNIVGTIQLQAKRWESTKGLREMRRLLLIESQLLLPDGTVIGSRMWIDEVGQVCKSEIPALQQVTYRVDRATALQASQNAMLDLADFALVPVQSALHQPHQTQQIRYRVQLANHDPSRVFPTTSSQIVRQIDDRTAEIIVSANGPATPLPAGPEPPPDANDRQPSPWIQSEDSIVQSLAQEAVGAVDDLAGQAQAIEYFVHKALTRKNFSTAFATAAEVAKTRAGDCTEHSVLTAAMCRARGIPARIVVGLIYVESRQAFAFHMWNSVWIRDRWVPLDATLGVGGTGAAHLRLSDSALDAGQSLVSFLPVIQVLGQLKLEILDVER